MNYKILSLILVLLTACESSNRLLPGRMPDEPVYQQTTTGQIYEGDFSGANFVELDLSSYQSLEVMLTVGPKKVTVYPNGYTEGQDIKEPYYVIRPDALVFFNVDSLDRYWIRVSE